MVVLVWTAVVALRVLILTVLSIEVIHIFRLCNSESSKMIVKMLVIVVSDSSSLSDGSSLSNHISYADVKLNNNDSNKRIWSCDSAGSCTII